MTAAIIVGVSEVAKRSDKLGALIVSLPLVTLLAMLWIFFDTSDEERVSKLSAHAAYTFWYVVPTLPFFLVIPILLKKGLHFSLVMLVYCVGTFVLFYLWAKVLELFDIQLLP